MHATSEQLGRYEQRYWRSDRHGPGRKHRREGPYVAFIPAAIAGRGFRLGDEAVNAVAEATRALTELNSSAPQQIASLEALARNLMRSEAVASSRIEGLVLSPQRLARAAYGHRRPSRDPRAAEILGNVEAMERAIELGARAGAPTVADIREIHSTLLRSSFDEHIAGVVRKRQNWIGGNDYNPFDAAYVPPPPEHVEQLLEDLCAFVERDDIAPLAQAAIAHAQFETIHPFADGNGRVGRALIYTVLRRRGEVARYIPPISLVLASEPKSYVAGLVDYREGRLGDWCTLFAKAASRAAAEAGALSKDIEAIQRQWLVRLGNPRSDAAVRQLVASLPEQPVIDVAAGQRLTGKSHVAVGKALKRLEEAGILRRLNERRWGRVWECEPLLELAGDFERLARGR